MIGRREKIRFKMDLKVAIYADGKNSSYQVKIHRMTGTSVIV